MYRQCIGALFGAVALVERYELHYEEPAHSEYLIRHNAL